MKRINPKTVIRSSTEARAYLKLLKDNGVFEQMVDGYMFAAAYAIKNNLDISLEPVNKKHDIAIMNVVNETIRLSLEAGIYAMCKRNEQSQPEDSKEVLDILTKYAEVGLKALKQRWEGKISIQIQNDICKIINFG